MSVDERPILGITMGDPTGIGPEIAVYAMSDPEVHKICRPLVVGVSYMMKGASRSPPRTRKASIRPP